MKLNVAVGLLCGALFAAACSSTDATLDVPSNPPTGPSQLGGPSEGPVNITRVRAFIREGRPQVFVEGELGDGCNSLQPITQRRSGNTFDISVPYRRQGDVCTMIMQFVNQWVALDGSFAAGEYVVSVNSQTVRFRLVTTPSGLRIEPDPGPLPEPPYFPR